MNRSIPRLLRPARQFIAWLLLSLFAIAPAFAQSYTWRNVQIVGGGYIPAVIFNPTEKNLIYLRTDIGGAYRWDETNQRWIPLLDAISFDDWNLTGVDSLATDPVNTSRLYILAGTYTNSWASQNGAILRSTDKGATFQRTMLPFKSGGNMPGRNMGERLVVDPNLDSTLYLGTRNGNGLWRSTDYGVTWSRVTSFTATGTYAQDPTDPNGYLSDKPGVVWVVFDPRSSTAGTATRTIYVGVADVGTSIYRSTDGGATWSALAGQPTGFLPHHAVLASTGILYVTYNNKGGPYDGEKGDVWKFNTATGAWTLISPVPSTSTDYYFGYGGLTVDAQKPNTIMVSALNSWWPDTILFRSTDGGATWTRIWDWAAYPSRTFRYVQDISAAPWLTFNNTNPQPPETSPKLGWMVGDLKIDPFNSNRMFYGTGATLYGTTDLTAWDAGSQIHLSVKALGIEETAVLDLISPPTGAPLISGLGDINGFRHDSLTTPPSRMLDTPFFSASSLDYAELSSSFITRVGDVNKTDNPNVNRAGFSYDGGTNWFQASVEPSGVTGPGTIAAAADASRVVWSPAGTTPYYSTNNGSSWIASSGAPAGMAVRSDRVNPAKFYGFASGTFYVSTNGGASFAATAATGLPTSAMFKAVPGREGDIWLAGGSDTTVYGIWHSTNGGASFTRLANVEKADNVGFGMPASGQTYPAIYTSAQVGGVRGLYRSTDAGATWTRINDNAHQYGFTGGAITGDPRVFGRVYVGTNGRGIIYGEPATTTTPDFSLAASPSAVAVTRGASATSTLTITRLNGFTGSVNLSVTGLPAGVTATFSVNPATGTSSVLTLAASSTATLGNATLTVSGAGTPGTRTTTLALTVNDVATPNFALSASPASVTINQGASGTSTINLTRSGGFTGSVSLTASGLPSGVTASFNPASTTGSSSVLTLTASASATVGNATVTVTGTGTPGTRTTTVALRVNQPTTTTPCSNPATIALPFTKDGAGEFCWVTSGNIGNINSWNLRLLEVNGVAFTNTWVSGASLPPRINGNYYIHYIGDYGWSHFEATAQ
jgi:photosystem II stability/assembly factor-like uncharacterized protein